MKLKQLEGTAEKGSKCPENQFVQYYTNRIRKPYF